MSENDIIFLVLGIVLGILILPRLLFLIIALMTDNPIVHMIEASRSDYRSCRYITPTPPKN
jgi:hypothetical protein